MTVTAIPPKATAENATEEVKPGKRKKLLIVLVLLIALGGGGWYFLAPDSDAAPVPGEVLTLEPIQVNLAAGHYLRLGLALQLVEGATHVDGSRALDAAISTFSGRDVATLVRGEDREGMREELLKKLDKAYHGDVLEVFFTEFVTQ